MARFEIRATGDADCQTVNDEVLGTCDDIGEAKRLAAELSAEPYGVAIVDTLTGSIDFGLDADAQCRVHGCARWRCDAERSSTSERGTHYYDSRDDDVEVER